MTLIADRSPTGRAVDPAQSRRAAFGLDCNLARDRDCRFLRIAGAAVCGLERAPQNPLEVPMTLTAISRTIALAASIATGATTGAAAQTTAADPHPPETTLTQATPPAEAGDTAGQNQGTQPAQPGMVQPGMMGQGMMGQGMMGQGMMGGMPMMRMRAHMMKIMFAIADTDGDGGMSFEEITAIQKRIFDKVDADKDGKVTPEEVQTFMRE